MKNLGEIKGKIFSKKGLKVVFIVVLAFILIKACIVTIPTGYVGVKTIFGAIQPNILSEGIHLKYPFIEKVVRIDCRTQKIELSCGAASRDLQTIDLIIAVNYNVRKDIANNLYGSVGLDFEQILISPAIAESVKSVTAQYTAEESITKRVEVSNKIKEVLIDKIEDKGFNVVEFNIVNLDFSEAYNSAIENKQIAEQQAKQAEYELVKAKINNEIKIEDAKANAEVMRLQNQETTDKTLQLKAIEKWNGILPTTALADALPFINIGK